MDADPDKKNENNDRHAAKDNELQNIENVDSQAVPGKEYPLAVPGGRENIVKIKKAKGHPRTG